MILQVFNRYLKEAGEERSVERIYRHIRDRHDIDKCFFDSKEWVGKGAPNKFSQASRLVYNHESAICFRTRVKQTRAEVALFHNIYPVGSPSLYREAQRLRLPVIQYMHNFRPFSPGGSLWAHGRNDESALRGNYIPEILSGSWQNSQLKTAIMAAAVGNLRVQGWLDSVVQWVAISEFVRDKLLLAGVDPARVTVLRHSWDAFEDAPEFGEDDYYLLPARLVEEKGIIETLAGWELLHSLLGELCPRLVIIGEGPLEKEVREATTRPGGKVSYAGYVDGPEKKKLFLRCKGVVVPSTWWEPLGIVVYEAYDYGKPVAASLSGGLKETVFEGRTGTGWKENTPEAIARAIINLEKIGAEGRRTMGEDGRKWLLENASVSSWKETFRDLLDRCIPGESGSLVLDNKQTPQTNFDD